VGALVRAFHPDLLEWLAKDLIENKYDLKRTLSLMLTSKAYQAPSIDDPNREKSEYVFRGPVTRRMSAEQYVDSVYAMTGKKERVWKDMGGRLLETLGRPDRRTFVDVAIDGVAERRRLARDAVRRGN
jgi:hypothetical protein